MTRRGHWALVAGRWGVRALLSSTAIAAAAVLLGCGSTGSGATDTASARRTESPSPEAKVVPLSLHVNEGSYSLSAPKTTISGTVTKGASVTVNGRVVAVRAGRWRDKLHLAIGSNSVEVGAEMAGHVTARRVIQVTRHHSPAELEALARARVHRVEVRKRHEAQRQERRERQQREEREKQEQASRAPSPECPNGTYENSAGNIVCKPYSRPEQPEGASAECEDGTYSFSESRSGTCSHHGGVRRWLNE